MRIIRNYILREMFFPFVTSLIVLTCVFLLGRLIQLTNLVINKGVSINTIWRVFLLSIPILLGYALPIACLVSIVLAFGRMAADNEIIAMRSSGIHLWSLLKPLVVLGLLISLFSIILNERIIPHAHHKQQTTLKSLGLSNPAALLEAGIFINSFDGQILFIHKVDGNKMYNVTIYQPQEGKPTRTIIAKRGEFVPIPGKDAIKLKLIDGTSDEPNLNDPSKFYKLNFDTFFMELDLSTKKQKREKKPKSMTLKELTVAIAKAERLFIDPYKHITEYHRKITWSFSSFVFIILGFPIAVAANKREKSANVVLAILCAVAYYFLSIGCEALSIKNVVNPAIVMWVPNVLLGSIAIYLNIKCVS